MLFEYGILCQKDFKNYVRNKSKGYDVLITTGIDYDDIIYYDAVNDVRKIFIIILIIKVQCPFLKV